MKKYLLSVLLCFLISFNSYARAYENLIWDDLGIKDAVKNNKDSDEVKSKKREKLDGEISLNLNVSLIYTNLEECLKMALENSNAIEIADKKVLNKKWIYYNSLARFLPDFNYSFTIQELYGEYLVGQIVPVTVREIPISSTYGVEWNITKNGKLFFDTSKNRNYLKSSKYMYKYTKDEVIKKTAEQYWDLVGKKLKVEIYKADLIDRQEQLKMTKAKWKVGSGSKFDVLRAEAQEASSKQQYINSINELRLQQGKIANTMGVDVLTPIYPYEFKISTKQLIDDKTSIEKLCNAAIEVRADVLAKKRELEALKAERSANYTDFFPKIVASYAMANVGTVKTGLRHNRTLTLNAQIQLGKNLGLGSYTQIKADNEAISQKELELETYISDIKEKILTSFYTSKSSLEKVNSALKELESAEESLRFAIVRWRIGESTFLDILEAQSSKIKAKQNVVDAIVSYNKSQVNLLFETGIISIDGILKNYDMPNSKIK